MPGRAIIVVYLTLAVLVALGLSRRLLQQRLFIIGGLIVVVAADYAAMPLPMGFVNVSRVYEQLAGKDGSVLELPLGIRDAFGEAGLFDSQTLLNQIVHRRPVLGGFVARLSPRLRRRYEQDPFIRSLLKASDGIEVIPPRGDPAALAAERRAAAEGLAASKVTTVVVNRALAGDELLRYVEYVLPLTRVGGDERHDVYVRSGLSR
jgi:hypothetical protein